jgi:regulator of nucleoside diphosphate kinase
MVNTKREVANMKGRAICITDYDLRRLSELLQVAKEFEYHNRDDLRKLRAELDRAKVVVSRDIPENVVTMNSKVVLIDLDTGESMTYTLVFPHDADIDQHKISIFAPIGTAMLGYGVGDTFEWKVPAGLRRLKVKEILYQPEAAGDYHL